MSERAEVAEENKQLGVQRRRTASNEPWGEETWGFLSEGFENMSVSTCDHFLSHIMKCWGGMECR